jgi:hypothetical protein
MLHTCANFRISVKKEEDGPSPIDRPSPVTGPVPMICRTQEGGDCSFSATLLRDVSPPWSPPSPHDLPNTRGWRLLVLPRLCCETFRRRGRRRCRSLHSPTPAPPPQMDRNTTVGNESGTVWWVLLGWRVRPCTWYLSPRVASSLMLFCGTLL